MRCATSSGCSMKFDFDSRTPGISTLPVGQLHVLEQRPLVRVARVRRLEGDAGRPGLEHDVDDVGERHVVVVRALVVAPADVHAQLLGRDVAQRVVQRRDVHLARARGSRRGRRPRTGCADPSPGPGSRAAARGPPRRSRRTPPASRPRWRRGTPRAWRSGRSGRRARSTPGDAARQEAACRLPAVERVAEVARRRSAAPRGRRRRSARCTPASCAASGPGSPNDLVAQHRELREVLVGERLARAAEAAEAVLDVGRVARLAHLAVVDDVDAGIDLALRRPPRRPSARARRGRPDRPGRPPPSRTSS